MGTTLPKLIEHLDSNLYKEYQMEMFREGKAGKEYNGSYKVKEPEFKFEKPVFRKSFGLESFEQLEDNHPAKKIFLKRGLPRASWNDIYYCPNFFEFTNKLVKDKFPSLDGDHPRMIIPFRKENGEIFAYQGRAFGKEPQKYITIILDKDYPKIFGMDRVDVNRPIYVTEGPFDSLFINNAVAVAQSDLRIPHLKDKVILVPDNEPRNKSITDQMSRCIDEGYRIVIWPNGVEEKDINDMILSGKTHAEIMMIIHSNTHQGLSAKTVFNNWKRN
jgi:hypothetical protein